MSEPGIRCWRPRRAPVNGPIPPVLRPWIDEPGSLTRRLRTLAGPAFRVVVLTEAWGRGWPDERRRLIGAGGERLWLREVLLCRGDTPLVHARSAIPAGSLRGPLRRLRRLGGQPLGSLLFGRYAVRRGQIEVAPVTASSRLGQRTLACGGHPAWARRSVFRIAGRPLLVTEVFLHSLLEEVDDDRYRR
mgnify:CR=1 FL=1